MRKKLLIPLFSILFLFSGAAVFAADLLVSDIDDTLKIAHVLDSLDTVKYAFKTSTPFRGMDRLLRLVTEQNPGLKVAYVSNAPKWLMHSSHQKFLQKNSFPSGSLILRGSASKEDHKYQVIQQLLDQEHPKKVIFLGDNGEMDSEIYEYFYLRNPQIQFYTFIHMVYSRYDFKETGAAKSSDQIGYVTPIEILANLEKSGWISAGSTNSELAKLLPLMRTEDRDDDDGALSFPDWMNCSDIWLPFLRVSSRQVSEYQALLLDRCPKSF